MKYETHRPNDGFSQLSNRDKKNLKSELEGEDLKKAFLGGKFFRVDKSVYSFEYKDDTVGFRIDTHKSTDTGFTFTDNEREKYYLELQDNDKKTYANVVYQELYANELSSNNPPYTFSDFCNAIIKSIESTEGKDGAQVVGIII